MAFERLLADDGDEIVPTEEDLAFFVAADGLHGLKPVILEHADYWLTQVQLAQDIGEPSREDLGAKLWRQLTLQGLGPQFDYDFTGHPRITAEVREGWRRTVMGGLALSMAVRSGMSEVLEGPIVDGRGIGKAEPLDLVYDTSIEASEREWPYEPRIHFLFNEEPLLPEKDMWYRDERLLVCFRYPADVTPVMEDYLTELRRPIDERLAITVMPHLTALHSPQFASN